MRKRYTEPKRYTIGPDMSEERYNAAILAIADWFSESRDTKEPASLARQAFQCCLDGLTQDGKPWFGAANATLAARVKIMCRYDILAMKPLRKANEKQRAKKEREKDQTAARRKAKQVDKLIPEELRKETAKATRYGDNPHVFLSSAEQQVWQTLHDAYTTQFPELVTVNASAELNQLCDLHVLSDRYRMLLLKGDAVDPAKIAQGVENMAGLKKALGIHPEQLAKRTKSKTDASIGAAAARLASMPNYRELRLKYFAEEMLMAFQMCATPNADGSGYQMDDVGLYGLTRSRPTQCPKCGQRQFAGISIDEIEAWLVEKGWLVPMAAAVIEVPETGLVSASGS